MPQRIERPVCYAIVVPTSASVTGFKYFYQWLWPAANHSRLELTDECNMAWASSEWDEAMTMLNKIEAKLGQDCYLTLYTEKS